MAALSPAGGDLITTEENVYTDATITATGFSTVDEWSWSITGVSAGAQDNPPNFVVTPDGLDLLVAYVTEDGLFPIQAIRFIDDQGQDQSVDRFEDLPPPAQSPVLYELREDTKSVLEWELAVTAAGQDTQSPSQPATASGTYTLTVFANYDTSRDKLVAAIEARK